MRLMDGYWTDGDGNKWNSEVFSLEEARLHSKSLVYCMGCVNCSGCRRCRRCHDCVDCFDCADCAGCAGCAICRRCVMCSDCRSCSDSRGRVDRYKLKEKVS